jgi:hypothetical protein
MSFVTLYWNSWEIQASSTGGGYLWNYRATAAVVGTRIATVYKHSRATLRDRKMMVMFMEAFRFIQSFFSTA